MSGILRGALLQGEGLMQGGKPQLFSASRLPLPSALLQADY